MADSELNISHIKRGLIVAPAGCGKTQFITDTLSKYDEKKPILILTHTNAGVAALRNRMNKAGVCNKKYRIATIDGWAIKLITTFPKTSKLDLNELKKEKPNYTLIRRSAHSMLKEGHFYDILGANYSKLIVDECQDCSKYQLGIIYRISFSMPTILLGDELQAIFDFGPGEDPLADWVKHVLEHFPLEYELKKPWRWINSGTAPLGEWLLGIREDLKNNKGIDLRKVPENITWIRLDNLPTDRDKLLKACNINPSEEGNILIIGDSRFPKSQQEFARDIFGASTVESVNLSDLVVFASNLKLNSSNALVKILEFAQSIMTKIEVKKFLSRIETLKSGKARVEANNPEIAALKFLKTPSFANLYELFVELRKTEGCRIYRPEIYRYCINALSSSHADLTFSDSVIRIRENNRFFGRSLPKKAVGSTLLLKGLESEVVIILNADVLNFKNLYVALTRGSKSIIVCSKEPIIGKK
ncbi:DEAD/DEAH box helicase family protein [Emticicia fontis]